MTWCQVTIQYCILLPFTHWNSAWWILDTHDNPAAVPLLQTIGSGMIFKKKEEVLLWFACILQLLLYYLWLWKLTDVVCMRASLPRLEMTLHHKHWIGIERSVYHFHGSLSISSFWYTLSNAMNYKRGYWTEHYSGQ